MIAKHPVPAIKSALTVNISFEAAFASRRQFTSDGMVFPDPIGRWLSAKD